MRYLCIDLGDKRTGIAIGDDLMRLASPVELIEVPITDHGGEALVNALLRSIDRNLSPHSPATLLFGLPLNMADGSEGPRAKIVRVFAARLEAKLSPPRPIHFHDERLSSVQADWQMSQSDLTHKQKKSRRDALAAAAILADFLSSRGPGASPGTATPDL